MLTGMSSSGGVESVKSLEYDHMFVDIHSTDQAKLCHEYSYTSQYMEIYLD